MENQPIAEKVKIGEEKDEVEQQLSKPEDQPDAKNVEKSEYETL